MKPHQSRYWLNPEIADLEQFEAEVALICRLYAMALTLHQAGVHLVSTDEKTGIQATERKHPTKPSRPGLIERREFEYIRHGTLALMANFEVATGRVVAPSIGPRRTESDFAKHIAQTIETDPEARWIFIVDRLNTHMSESLVRLVAYCLGMAQHGLGEKGKAGILASKKTRAAFLSSPEHRIRFVYTWMALLVVKSGGDLVFDFGAASVEAGQFHLDGGPAWADLGLHWVFQ